VLFSLLLTACGEEKPVTNPEMNVSNSIPNTTLKEDKILNEMGFDFKDNKLTIDINKSNEFFTNMQKQLEKKTLEIEQKIKNSDINFSKGMGVDVTDETINIDLNETKKMLHQMNILMKEIFLDKKSSND
jgi:uncharacterized protein YpuA (DUF1002 family)